MIANLPFSDHNLFKEAALSLGTVVFLFVFYGIFRAFLSRVRKRHGLQVHREIILARVMKVGLCLVGGLLIVLIWGIRQQSLWIFLSSLAGLIGVSIFASWSHLSNIFAAFLLFFTSRIRIGDLMTLQDGDNSVKGRVKDMGMIFVFLEDGKGRLLSIPNSLVLQRTVLLEKD